GRGDVSKTPGSAACDLRCASLAEPLARELRADSDRPATGSRHTWPWHETRRRVVRAAAAVRWRHHGTGAGMTIAETARHLIHGVDLLSPYAWADRWRKAREFEHDAGTEAQLAWRQKRLLL